jgi:hypothetical protein
MMNISISKLVLRFFTILAIGIMATLMASAMMNIKYHFQYRAISETHDLLNWIIVGGAIGILLGIVSNRSVLVKRDMRLISLALVRIVIIALIIAGVSTAIWYYYKVDYFPLKDNGPLALIVGLIFGMWDLLNRTSSIAERVN